LRREGRGGGRKKGERVRVHLSYISGIGRIRKEVRGGKKRKGKKRSSSSLFHIVPRREGRKKAERKRREKMREYSSPPMAARRKDSKDATTAPSILVRGENPKKRGCFVVGDDNKEA